MPTANAPTAPQLPLGRSLRAADRPLLAPQVADLPGQHSLIGADWAFEGQAWVQGSVTVAGSFTGQLQARARAAGEAGNRGGAVHVPAGGQVHGRVRAQDIQVHGHIEGELDASGGRVSLFETAVVHAQVRYTQLQVHGAELNGQLQRVRADEVPPPVA